jgi:hypothetical protein
MWSGELMFDLKAERLALAHLSKATEKNSLFVPFFFVFGNQQGEQKFEPLGKEIILVRYNNFVKELLDGLKIYSSHGDGSISILRNTQTVQLCKSNFISLVFYS